MLVAHFRAFFAGEEKSCACIILRLDAGRAPLFDRPPGKIAAFGI